MSYIASYPMSGFLSRNRHQHRHGSFPVRMDIIETEGMFRILAEVPGIEKDRIKVMVNNGILTISGERPGDKDDIRNAIRSERFHGSFSRSFRLPESVDAGRISADYDNGMLEVTLPLKEEVKPREIEVKVS